MSEDDVLITEDTIHRLRFSYLVQEFSITPAMIRDAMAKEGLNQDSYTKGEWRAIYKIIERMGTEYERTVARRAVQEFKTPKVHPLRTDFDEGSQFN